MEPHRSTATGAPSALSLPPSLSSSHYRGDALVPQPQVVVAMPAQCLPHLEVLAFPLCGVPLAVNRLSLITAPTHRQEIRSRYTVFVGGCSHS